MTAIHNLLLVSILILAFVPRWLYSHDQVNVYYTTWLPLLGLLVAAITPHFMHRTMYADNTTFTHSMPTYYRYWLQSNTWSLIAHIVTHCLYGGITNHELSYPVEIAKMMAFGFAFETGFYWLHRLYHSSPLIYRFIHSAHHTANANVCIWDSFVNTHVEHMMLNGALHSMLCHLLCFHTITFAITTVIVAYQSCRDHSVYDPIHQLHHKRVRCNYGGNLHLWDTIMGTLIRP